MKCVVLHESNKKVRIKIPILRMTYRQADLIECYIRNIPEVRDVSVDERTCNAIITFKKEAADNKSALFAALAVYDENDESVTSLVQEETGREMNRRYQEKLVMQILKHVMCKIYLPLPVATVRCVIKSIPYLYKAVTSLLQGKLEVATLDGIAIAASILQRDFSTASSIMFLLDTGDTLEEWTRKKSIGDLARSMSLNVDKVWIKQDNGEVQIGINDVHVGDKVVVRSSDVIPLDGKVVEGEMTVNQSTMTGESEPVMKNTGGYVYAGTVVEDGECIIEVTKESGSGKYDQIVHMIEESEKLKSNTEAKAYRLADSLVPYSLGGAILSYLFTRNVNKALSFLMVDYSCAMKLSMPLAVLSAIREARDYGISVKGGKYMEAVAEADTIVFDKTGTLTHAQPQLVDIVTFGGKDANEMLRIAACLEEHYPHSVANAIVNGAKERGLYHEELHSKVEYIVAHGVSSHIGGKKAVIGSYHFVLEDEGCTVSQEERYKLDEIKPEYSRVYLAIDGELVAILCIFDPVREEAQTVIKELHKLGIKKVCMMTGDNQKTAQVVAEKLGLDEYYAEVLPEDKAMFISKQHEKGHKVIMIGDGVNDSPALSKADVGIAIAEGAAIAREVADITISSDSLMQVVAVRKISLALMERIHSNYRFILGFNSTLIGLGFFGVITPSSSALLHNGSTIMTGLKSMTNLLDEK